MRLLPSIALAAALILPLTTPSQASAQALTLSNDQLRAWVASQMPGTWQVKEFAVEAQANIGTPVDPQIRTRFRLKLALAAPTFDVVNKVGSFTFARPVAKAGETRDAFGVSESVYRAGQWAHQMQIENKDALAGLGMLEASVPGRLVVIGTDDEKKVRAQFEAEAKRDQDAKIAAAKQAADAEAAQLEAGRAVREQKAQEAGRLAAMQIAAQRQAESAKLQEELDALKKAQADRISLLAETRKLSDEQAEATRLYNEAMIAGRRKAFDAFKEQAANPDRSVRLAAIETAVKSEDPTIRALGYEAAFASKDIIIQGAGLKSFLLNNRKLPVQVFAPEAWKQGENPPQNLINQAGAISLDLIELNVNDGQINGRITMGKETLPLTGKLSGIDLALMVKNAGPPLYNTSASCGLDLRLTGFQSLDGTMKCTGYAPVLLRIPTSS